MRILVFSDSHGRPSAMERVIADQPEASDVLFLGDVLSDIEHLPYLFPDKNFISVAGNNDFYSSEPSSRLIKLYGKTVFMTHGHTLAVKRGLQELIKTGKRNGADIMLYGHTHIAFCDYIDGMYILCPGSVSRPAAGRAGYGVIDITGAGVVTYVSAL